MYNYFADNLKTMRKQREITQEDLAGFLGVTFQAVSKWERGESYPDITLLPALANFFGVTLDELMGMENLRNGEDPEKVIARAGDFASKGEIAPAVATLQEGLSVFPNNFAIMGDLALYLDGFGSSDAERKKNQDEAVRLSERILEYCKDQRLLSNVRGNMCFTLWRNGDQKKAIDSARTLPNLYHTEDFTLPKLLEGDEKIAFCGQVIQKLCWGFWWIVNRLAEEPRYSNAEKIRLLQAADAFYQIVYEEKDFGFANVRLEDVHETIADLLLQDGKIDEAFDHLEKAADYACAYDRITGDYPHTSLLVNGLIFNKGGTVKYPTLAASEQLMQHLVQDNEAFYQRYRDDERMRKLMKKLKTPGKSEE